MYRLYTRPNTGGFVVEAMLEMIGADFECIAVPRDKSEQDETFRAISPLGQIPVLTLPDGQSMTESSAMCVLLAERHPEAGLAPLPGTAERAAFLRWMAFLSFNTYAPLLRQNYSSRYTTAADGSAAVEQAAVAEINTGLGIVDRALEGRDWLVGDSMSAADLYLFMLACWHPGGSEALAGWPNVARLVERLKSNAVILALNASHKMW